VTKESRAGKEEKGRRVEVGRATSETGARGSKRWTRRERKRGSSGECASEQGSTGGGIWRKDSPLTPTVPPSGDLTNKRAKKILSEGLEYLVSGDGGGESKD